MNSAPAVAVCGFRRYTSVICLCFGLYNNANNTSITLILIVTIILIITITSG